jgi:hypothetical protein
MKLKNEYEYIYTQFQNHLEEIKEYALQLKASGQYKDFEVRLIWDCIRAFVGSGTVCLWYDRYDCNDSHITTVGKKALKELGVL